MALHSWTSLRDFHFDTLRRRKPGHLQEEAARQTRSKRQGPGVQESRSPGAVSFTFHHSSVLHSRAIDLVLGCLRHLGKLPEVCFASMLHLMHFGCPVRSKRHEKRSLKYHHHPFQQKTIKKCELRQRPSFEVLHVVLQRLTSYELCRPQQLHSWCCKRGFIRQGDRAAPTIGEQKFKEKVERHCCQH